MKNRFNGTTLVSGVLLMAVSGSLFAGGCGADYCIEWHSIDSGGVMHAETGNEQWQLSGTIGQWDATAARELTGGEWHLTGGFWGLTLEELADRLFSDRFEEDNE